MDKEIKNLLNLNRILTPDEEFQVFTYYEKIKKSNNLELIKEVRNAILVKNLPLAYSFVTSKFYMQTDSREDLMQEAALGLAIAIEKFDPHKGNKFSTYASHWIFQAISRYNYTKAKIIRIPVHIEEKYYPIYKSIREYQLNHSEEPSYKTLAELTNQTDAEVEKILTVYQQLNPVSLNTAVGETEHGDVTELGDFIPDEIPDIADSINFSVDMELFIKRIKDILTKKEYDVIARRFGLDGYDRSTLEEVGLAYGVTRERIRQIESKAIKKIRAPHNMRHYRSLKEYLV